jgi:hypothetical protein
MAKGAQVTTMSFPGKLFDEPAIISTLANFTYFECDLIHVECRCNSNINNKGTLLICYMPHWLFDPGVTRWIAGQVTNTSLAVASMAPHVLIKASSNVTVTFDIPMVTPKQLFKLSDLATMLGYFGAFEVYVMNKLAAVNSGATIPTCEVSFYANFVNPRPSGLTYASPAAGLLPAPQGEPRRVKDEEPGKDKMVGHSGGENVASMHDRFKKSFEPLGGGKIILEDVISTEKIVSLRDLLHRFQYAGLIPGALVTVDHFEYDGTWNGITKTTYNAITHLKQMFRFRRGGWSVMVNVPIGSEVSFELNTPDFYQEGDGSSFQVAAGMIKQHAFESTKQGINVPWYSTHGFKGSPFHDTDATRAVITPSADGERYHAISEDFNWSWIVGPMPHASIAANPDQIGRSKIGLDDEVDVIREIQRQNIRPKALPLRGREFKGKPDRTPTPRLVRG